MCFLGCSIGPAEFWGDNNLQVPFIFMCFGCNIGTEFWGDTNVQLLAVGDKQGTLHILEIPRTLRRPVAQEENMMLALLTREQVSYIYSLDVLCVCVCVCLYACVCVKHARAHTQTHIHIQIHI